MQEPGTPCADRDEARSFAQLCSVPHCSSLALNCTAAPPTSSSTYLCHTETISTLQAAITNPIRVEQPRLNQLDAFNPTLQASLFQLALEGRYGAVLLPQGVLALALCKAATQQTGSSSTCSGSAQDYERAQQQQQHGQQGMQHERALALLRLAMVLLMRQGAAACSSVRRLAMAEVEEV